MRKYERSIALRVYFDCSRIFLALDITRKLTIARYLYLLSQIPNPSISLPSMTLGRKVVLDSYFSGRLGSDSFTFLYRLNSDSTQIPHLLT